eukprot:m.455404 g.455404  ORF g.455404 m.455404 type:complete len:525 (+) comp20864_c0_seq1:230-1804(+)
MAGAGGTVRLLGTTSASPDTEQPDRQPYNPPIALVAGRRGSQSEDWNDDTASPNLTVDVVSAPLHQVTSPWRAPPPREMVMGPGWTAIAGVSEAVISADAAEVPVLESETDSHATARDSDVERALQDVLVASGETAPDSVPEMASDSPVWQDSEEEEEDELPMYEAVKLVTENQPNIQITVVFTDGDHESVQVSAADVDSIDQLRKRISRVTRDGELDPAQIELSKPSMTTALPHEQSLLQLGIHDNSTVHVHKLEPAASSANPATGVSAPLLSGGASKPEEHAVVATVPQRIVSRAGKRVSHEDSDPDESDPPAYSMLDRAIHHTRRDMTPLSPLEKFGQVVMILFMFILLVGFFVALPVALIAVGASNLDKCPARRDIPIWMIVFGVVYLVQSGLDRTIAVIRSTIEHEIRRRPDFEVMPLTRVRIMVDHEYRKRHRRLDQFDQLSQTFGFIWFVIGSVWVFGCSDCKSDFDAATDTGCDQATYRFSLVMIVVLYILLAVPFLAILLYLIGMTLCRDSRSGD